MKFSFVSSFITLTTCFALGQSCQAAGHVTAPTETALDTALSAGGKVVFDCDASLTFSSTKTISVDTEINANGHAVTFSGGGVRQIIRVGQGVALTIKGLRLENGLSKGGDGANEIWGHFGPAGGIAGGGAIFLDTTTKLYADHCVFTGNQAIGGNGGRGGDGTQDDHNARPGGLGGDGGNAAGGAICALGQASPPYPYNVPDTEIHLSDCTFSNNKVAGGSGGDGGHAHRQPGPEPGWSGAAGGDGGYGGKALGGAVALVSPDLSNAPPSSTMDVRACLFGDNQALGGNGGSGGDGGPGTDNSYYDATANVTVYTGEGGQGGAGGAGQAAGSALGGSLYGVNGKIFNSTFARNQAQGGWGGSGGPGHWGGYGSIRGRGGAGGVGGAGGDATGGGFFFDWGGLTGGNGWVTNCTLVDNVVQGGYGGNGAPGVLVPAIVKLLTDPIFGYSYTPVSDQDRPRYPNPGAGGAGGTGYGGGTNSLAGLASCTLSGNGALGRSAGQGGRELPEGPYAVGGTNGTGKGGAIYGGAITNCLLEKSRGGNASVETTDWGGNICDDASLALQTTTSRNSTNPLLGPLADNGGPTPTMALLAGSPAIDVASPTGYDLFFADQRGYGRHGAADAGAFEYQGRVRAQATPLVVTTTANRIDEFDNLTSLPEAINYANAHEGPDTIKFALEKDDPGYDAATGVYMCDGGGQPIDRLSTLPIILDDNTTLDGSSQTTFGGDTNPAGPEIGINHTSPYPALIIQANKCLLQNLWFVPGSSAQSLGLLGNYNTVRACYLGTDAKGAFPSDVTTTTSNGGIGLRIFDSGDGAPCDHNIIGGDTTADGNRINGVSLYQANDNLIRHNVIACYWGIDLYQDNGTIVRDNQITAYTGVSIREQSNDSLVQNNDINASYGVQVSNSSQRNSIRFNRLINTDNGSGGIRLDAGVANDNLDGDAGSNGLQNHPVLSSTTKNASTTTVTGSLNSKAGSTYLLDFYAGAARDYDNYHTAPTAARFLGTKSVTTDASGNATFSFSTTEAMTLGEWVTATATDASGNTSELCPESTVVRFNRVPSVTVTLAPIPAYRGAKLSAITIKTDADSDTVSLRYVWKRGGQVIAGQTSATLDGGALSLRKGEVVRVEVTPNDGLADGATTAAQLTIANSLPTAKVTLSPISPRASSTLTAAVTTSDADGDAVTPRYVWKRNGVILTGKTTATLSLASITGLKSGEIIRVEVTPYDGSVTGVTVAAQVTVASTPIVCGADNYSTKEDVALRILGLSLLANDTGGNAPLAVTGVTLKTAGAGTVALTSTGVWTYTPALNWNGTASFGYSVKDASGVLAAGNATVVVTPVNDAPVAQSSSFVGKENLTISGQVRATDADNNPLAYALVSTVKHGKLVLNPNGTFVYTPTALWNGSDSFSFRAVDSTNTPSAAATIALTVQAVNAAPVAVADILKGTEDVPLSIATSTLLANDKNGEAVGEADVLHVVAVTAPVGFPGKLTLDAARGTILFVPNPNWNGTTSFSYTIEDSGRLRSTSTTTVQLAPVNDAPSAQNATATVTSGVLTTVILSATDVDGDALQLSLSTAPLHGVANLNFSGGQWRLGYRSVAGYSGTETFAFVAKDRSSTSAPATITLTVKPGASASPSAPTS